MNLWHDLTLGEKAPEQFRVIIEIPKGSKNKYEIDKETGLIKLDRAMKTAQDYPFDYGFAPQTLWEDNDPLDVILLTTYPLHPGIMVDVRPVAVMRMIDGGEGDDKIITVPVNDPRWEEVKDLHDINKHTVKEIQHFFETYKQIENKVVEISGWEGRESAIEAVKKSVELYNAKYTK
ncbi:MAG: inorganic pyrophosphatase [Candidatus Magasanikbacteria bacterium CG_4_9_14_3_um_filter_32_9]|uniref:Inorganic pyrophosphatase n=1 Tax=Candidatus Magasanikbacteria bacterium CG_4_9_14_3_um_filter_32_9 TaxID=1974644 RepID=A0A2M7Z628_9BACT|nr:MAG: inorganic pyrophosphatase [Candidatus Magasanikbacteria bacterium CG_4_9_14_3_um_filter_32_9]